jgi:hypothetical protein
LSSSLFQDNKQRVRSDDDEGRIRHQADVFSASARSETVVGFSPVIGGDGACWASDVITWGFHHQSRPSLSISAFGFPTSLSPLTTFYPHIVAVYLGPGAVSYLASLW